MNTSYLLPLLQKIAAGRHPTKTQHEELTRDGYLTEIGALTPKGTQLIKTVEKLQNAETRTWHPLGKRNPLTITADEGHIVVTITGDTPGTIAAGDARAIAHALREAADHAEGKTK